VKVLIIAVNGKEVCLQLKTLPTLSFEQWF